MMSEGGYPIYRRCSPEKGGKSFFMHRKGKPVTYLQIVMLFPTTSRHPRAIEETEENKNH